MNAWVDAGTGVPIDSWEGDCGCGPTPPNVTAVQKTLTLYYRAASGQVSFPLSTPDLYGQAYTLVATSTLTVTRNGSRLTPDDGSGIGGYHVDPLLNAVTLLWPAGDGELVIVDVYDTALAEGPPGPIGPPGATGPPGLIGAPGLPQTIWQDYLTIVAANVIPTLSHPPNGATLILYVEGRPFFASGPNPAFTYLGKTLSWISTLYSVQPGNEVVALYTS